MISKQNITILSKYMMGNLNLKCIFVNIEVMYTFFSDVIFFIPGFSKGVDTQNSLESFRIPIFIHEHREDRGISIFLVL
jgi:hypothetical protein